jgi:AcrR family transcriptional regulator
MGAWMARTTTRPVSAERRRRWADGYDPENTRRSLITSALLLFERRGFDRTSVQEIADHARVTKGAFYHHFENKDDLLRHIQEEYLEAQLAAIRRIEAGSDDPKVRVIELIRFSLTSVAEYRAHVTIFQQEHRYVAGDVARKRDLVEAAFAAIVQDGVAKGAFRSDVDARIAMFGLVGMCASAYQWLNLAGPVSVEEVARQFSAMVFEGLCA